MPKFEVRMIGRRPKRSDSAPCTGEEISCITAQLVPNTPKIIASWPAFTCATCWISCGITGITIPIATMSSTMVMKMKMVAARRGCGACGSVSGELDAVT